MILIPAVITTTHPDEHEHTVKGEGMGDTVRGPGDPAVVRSSSLPPDLSSLERSRCPPTVQSVASTAAVAATPKINRGGHAYDIVVEARNEGSVGFHNHRESPLGPSPG